MDAGELKCILAELRFSAELPTEAIDQLADTTTIRSVSAGQIVFREGGTSGSLFLIRGGRIALEMNVPGRDVVRILTLGPGEMMGWSALLSQGRMTTSAVAVQDSELVVVAADKLQELCEVNHEFGFHLMRQMAAALSQRLVATRLQLLDLFADAPPMLPSNTADRD
jgi:CRP/FNR family cyclic AMP-dependent transcriptional regulator